jgi:hypothetical protein
MNATHENPYLAFALWRQEVVVEMPEECRWPVPYQAAEGASNYQLVTARNYFMFQTQP